MEMLFLRRYALPSANVRRWCGCTHLDSLDSIQSCRWPPRVFIAASTQELNCVWLAILRDRLKVLMKSFRWTSRSTSLSSISGASRCFTQKQAGEKCQTRKSPRRPSCYYHVLQLQPLAINLSLSSSVCSITPESKGDSGHTNYFHLPSFESLLVTKATGVVRKVSSRLQSVITSTKGCHQKCVGSVG